VTISFRSIGAAAFAVTLGVAAAAAAQSNFGGSASDDGSPARAKGWVFTPALVYSTSWDDNILLRGTGDDQIADNLHVLNPSGHLDYNGKRGQLNLVYDGAFLIYRQFGGLDAYDQHATLSGRRALSKRISLYASNTFAMAPTTELVQLIAVPFIRTGSDIDAMAAGLDAVLTKHATLSVNYNFEWVHFEAPPEFAFQLRGGHAHGGSIAYKYLVSPRTTLTATYQLQHALVGGSTQTFDIQMFLVGGDRRLTEATHVYGAIGAAHLGISAFSQAQTGLAWHAGLGHQLGRASIDVSYSRSFVPSYGFGGTQQNEDLGAGVRLPLARRLYAASSFSWRRDQPLAANQLRLHSLWYEGALGYELTPWARLEGFYALSRQTIDRPGGVIDRSRIGFQVVTARPMRVR
jgi:hypothetical protein